jgi:hypothetical protein
VQIQERLKGKVTLSCVAFRKYGSQMGDTWGEFLLPKVEGREDKLQYLKIVIYDDFFHRLFLKGFALRGLKKSVAVERQGDWLLCFDRRATVVQEELKIVNNMTNYVFLTDAEGRIRWRASGFLQENEGDGDILMRMMSELEDERDGVARDEGGSIVEPISPSSKPAPVIGAPKRSEAGVNPNDNVYRSKKNKKKGKQ